MKRVNVAAMKSRLSQYLAYVRKGGAIRIYDRDQPVADLIPLDERHQGSRGALESVIDVHVRNGVVDRGSGRLKLPRRIRSKKSIVEAIVQERREGR